MAKKQAAVDDQSGAGADVDAEAKAKADAEAAAAAKAAADAAAAKPAAPELVTLVAPEGTSGVNFRGMLVEVKDGVVKVEAWVAAHLKEAFGFIEKL